MRDGSELYPAVWLHCRDGVHDEFAMRRWKCLQWSRDLQWRVLRFRCPTELRRRHFLHERFMQLANGCVRAYAEQQHL